ncbi:hypothetical protein [Haloarcula sp. CGMCC 1.6347]|uniref:hypothetical protein n=1 Tax=Haloarcula sp. CGMCC 1.6347 TaxID=3111455 RepID=UPI00300F4E28
MTDQKHPERIDELRECVENIGGEVLSTRAVDSHNGELWVLLCRHGNDTYNIIEQTNINAFLIRYDFSLIRIIASRLSDEQIEGRIEDELDDDRNVNIPESLLEASESEDAELVVQTSDDELPPEMQAAEKIIESLENDSLERFGLNLFQKASHPEVATELVRTTDGFFEGFRISRKIFPDDEGFNLTEFNNSVQSVMSVGTFGNNLVADLFESELEGLAELGLEASESS